MRQNYFSFIGIKECCSYLYRGNLPLFLKPSIFENQPCKRKNYNISHFKQLIFSNKFSYMYFVFLLLYRYLNPLYVLLFPSVMSAVKHQTINAPFFPGGILHHSWCHDFWCACLLRIWQWKSAALGR